MASQYAAGAELDADAGPDGACRLGDGVLHGALAGAAHHDEVAVAEGEAQQGGAAVAGAQDEVAGVADGEDRDEGVLGGGAAVAVAVPGDAVAAVAVEAEPGGDEGFAEFGGVVGTESLAGLGEDGVRQGVAAP